MLKSNLNLYLYLCFLLIFNNVCNGAAVNYNPYDNKQQHHLLHATNTANDGYRAAQQAAFNVNTVYQTNLQGNSNYEQLYRYYYTPPPPPPPSNQLPLQPQQSAQLWSGPPIVVEDDIQQQQRQSSTNIPPTFYQQHSIGGIRSSSESLPFLTDRQSKVLTPTVYSPQPTTTRTAQTYFNNNNNNNIIYHRDFRPDIYVMPESEHTRRQGDDNTFAWHNQQQQNRLLEQQQSLQQNQPPTFPTSDTNLSYNGIYNDLFATSLRKVDVPDYGEHFKRYLENNPRRIKPIY